MGVISGKVLVNLYLVIPLVDIPETLLREVEGHEMFCYCCVPTPQSGIDGRFDRWRPPYQLMTSMFESGVPKSVGGGMVCHIFVSRLRVTRVPWDFLLLVERVVLTTDPPHGAQLGAAILVTGGWAAQNLDFHALRTPCSCEESVLCT